MAYPYYVVSKATGRVVAGADYREDAKEMQEDLPWPKAETQVLTAAGVRRKHGKIVWQRLPAPTLKQNAGKGIARNKTRSNFSRGALRVKGYTTDNRDFSFDPTMVDVSGLPDLTERSTEKQLRAWLDKVEPKWRGAALTVQKTVADLSKY